MNDVLHTLVEAIMAFLRNHRWAIKPILRKPVFVCISPNQLRPRCTTNLISSKTVAVFLLLVRRYRRLLGLTPYDTPLIPRISYEPNRVATVVFGREECDNV